ncbi:hypothetical protein GCM10010411_64720 [Actinomadura fulvescens]|uniref:Uncharacterized protein n=1 Tax=Actinomadura fulvescens TaxID=46160 RepID=A0ABP6CKN2_9ACTN
MGGTEGSAPPIPWKLDDFQGCATNPAFGPPFAPVATKDAALRSLTGETGHDCTVPGCEAGRKGGATQPKGQEDGSS